MTNNPQFVMLPYELIDSGIMDQSAFTVYVALLRHRSTDTGYAWPGIRTIAREARVTPNTTTKAIERLVELGIVTIVDKGRGKRTVYAVALWDDFPNAPTVPDSATVPAQGTVVDSATVEVETVSESATDEASDTDSNCRNRAPKVSQLWGQTVAKSGTELDVELDKELDKRTPLPPEEKMAHSRPKDGGDKNLPVPRTPESDAAANRIVDLFENHTGTPLGDARPAITRAVAAALTDGIPAQRIADGLTAWAASTSWSPSQIRNFILKAGVTTQSTTDRKLAESARLYRPEWDDDTTPNPALDSGQPVFGSSRPQSTTDRRVADALAVAATFADDDTPPPDPHALSQPVFGNSRPQSTTDQRVADALSLMRPEWDDEDTPSPALNDGLPVFGRAPRPLSTTDQRVAEGLALAAKYAELDGDTPTDPATGCDRCDDFGWLLAADGTPIEPATRCTHISPPALVPEPEPERATTRRKAGRPPLPPGQLGQINVTALPTGRYQAQAWFRDAHGHRKRLRARGDSPEAARDQVRENHARLIDGQASA